MLGNDVAETFLSASADCRQLPSHQRTTMNVSVDSTALAAVREARTGDNGGSCGAYRRSGMGLTAMALGYSLLSKWKHHFERCFHNGKLFFGRKLNFKFCSPRIQKLSSQWNGGCVGGEEGDPWVGKCVCEGRGEEFLHLSLSSLAFWAGTELQTLHPEFKI